MLPYLIYVQGENVREQGGQDGGVGAVGAEGRPG